MTRPPCHGGCPRPLEVRGSNRARCRACGTIYHVERGTLALTTDRPGAHMVREPNLPRHLDSTIRSRA